MKVKQSESWIGQYSVVVRDNKSGKVKEKTDLKNMITDQALLLLAGFLAGDETNGEILYMALGSGDAEPTAEDTTLESEEFRTPIETTTLDPSIDGVLHSEAYVEPSEANDFQIEEIGWFAKNATATADSGVMIARTLYSRQKLETESITIVRTDSIGRG